MSTGEILSYSTGSPIQRRQADVERFLLILFLTVATIFSFVPIRNQIHKMRQGEDGTKDYPLWYDTGHRELHGITPYYLDRHNEFPFMYPPGAAAILAPLTVFGKLPLVIFLVLLNSAAWATCIAAPLYLLTGRVRGQPHVLYWLPSLVCCVFIWDTYLEGQLAFVLSALLLGMLVFLSRGKQLRAGALLAIAAGFKAFPILALPYLIYRRYWTALATTVIALIVLLLLMPAIFRGPGGAWDDLVTWKNGMLSGNTPTKISATARGERSYTWQNGSVLAVTHRWFRHATADTDSDSHNRPLPPIWINIANLPLKTCNYIADGILLLLGLGYIAVTIGTPRRRFVLAAEAAMLLILIILASPLSFTYNNSWLMCAIAVILYFITQQPNWNRQAKIASIWLALALFPLIFSISTGDPLWRHIRALGNTCLTDLLLLAELAWVTLTWTRKSGARSASTPR